MIRPNQLSSFPFSRGVVLAAGIFLPAALLVYGADAAQVSKRRARSHSASSAASSTQVSFDKNVAPLLKKYCLSCHSGTSAQSGVALDKYKSVATILKDRDTWDRVANAVSASAMPPAGMPHPTSAERERLATWIQTSLSTAACDVKDPGSVTLRRLNREEYNNTVRDLFGMDLRPGDEFPNDDVGYGFDNIGDVLSISPLLMEKYLNAAEKVSKTLVVLPGAAPEMLKRVQAAQGTQTAGSGQVYGDGYRILQTEGEISVPFDFPQTGEYEIRAKAFQQRVGPEPAKMSFRVDGKYIKGVDVATGANNPTTFFVRTPVQAGKRPVAVAFTNPFHDNTPAPEGKRRPEFRPLDRTLTVMYLEVVGPFDTKTQPTDAQRKLIVESPKENTPEAWTAAAKKDLRPFAARAFRRPVSDAEVNRLVRCALLARDNGEPFERGMQLAIQATLVSPNFLFRVEVEPQGTSPNSLLRKEGAKRPAERMLNPYELASRLSYFLWSSMPDEELTRAAANGSLLKAAGLRYHVARMLKDPKSKALGENFAGQWLMLRSLKNVQPNRDQFTDFDDTLRASMKTETEMFFNAVVREDRSILDFIDGKFTYLNEPLAKHYGIAGVEGGNFRKVALTDGERGGILTQASVLTVTSNPTRTSPVKRGKWVLENLLGTPPPPPPQVFELDKPGAQLTGTLRQRMEQHRKNPMCASCHARMDPIGFGLENFDAVGRWRQKDGDAKIDASGALPGGIKFDGPAGLEKYLKTKKELFTRCLSEKMLTYAIGRGLENYDRCNLDAIIKNVAKNNYQFSSLVLAVAESDPFRKRRGEGP
jgi:mono/diheme cytochrome c family protein